MPAPSRPEATPKVRLPLKDGHPEGSYERPVMRCDGISRYRAESAHKAWGRPARWAAPSRTPRASFWDQSSPERRHRRPGRTSPEHRNPRHPLPGRRQRGVGAMARGPDEPCCELLGQWVSSGRNFFLSVRVLSRLFRRLFLDELVRLHEVGELAFFNDLAMLSPAIRLWRARRYD
jgi:hypothetical protein